MSAQEHAALYRRFVDEVINKGNYDVAPELIAANFVTHNPQPGTPSDYDGYIQSFRTLRAAFPDLHVTIDELVVEGDQIAGRGTVRGTHTGEMAGPMGAIPASGKPIAVGYINIIRVQDGKAIEEWAQLDTLGMMQQIGVIPAPELAAAT